MIDTSKCEYEESFKDDDLDLEVFYFTYPKDLQEIKFYTEEDDDVVNMCISLTRYKNGQITLQMSPTIQDEDYMIDIDWEDLCEGENYTEETIAELLAKVNIEKSHFGR